MVGQPCRHLPRLRRPSLHAPPPTDNTASAFLPAAATAGGSGSARGSGSGSARGEAAEGAEGEAGAITIDPEAEARAAIAEAKAAFAEAVTEAEKQQQQHQQPATLKSPGSSLRSSGGAAPESGRGKGAKKAAGSKGKPSPRGK